MTERELRIALCAVLATAAEKEAETIPESLIYIVLGNDMAKFECLKAILEGNELATFKNHALKLTKKGLELAAKVQAVVKKGE